MAIFNKTTQEETKRMPITKEGYARLTKGMNELKERRLAIIQQRGEARNQVHTTKSGEYLAVEDEFTRINERFKFLNHALENADIIDPTQLVNDGRCIFGTTVDLESIAGEKITYQIVGELEAAIKDGLLSSSSPVGKALLGKCDGDEVLVETLDGVLQYTVRAVRYEGEKASAKIIEKPKEIRNVEKPDVREADTIKTTAEKSTKAIEKPKEIENAEKIDVQEADIIKTTNETSSEHEEISAVAEVQVTTKDGKLLKKIRKKETAIWSNLFSWMK